MRRTCPDCAETKAGVWTIWQASLLPVEGVARPSKPGIVDDEVDFRCSMHAAKCLFEPWSQLHPGGPSVRLHILEPRDLWLSKSFISNRRMEHADTPITVLRSASSPVGQNIYKSNPADPDSSLLFCQPTCRSGWSTSPRRFVAWVSAVLNAYPSRQNPRRSFTEFSSPMHERRPSMPAWISLGCILTMGELLRR